MNREHLIVGSVIMLLLGPMVGPALAATVQTVFVGGGTPVATQSGLAVRPNNDTQLNLKDPFVASDAVRFRNVTFRGESASLRVDNFGDPGAASAGVWTNVSGVDASSGQVLIDRQDARQIGAGGTVDALRVRDSDLSRGGQKVDVVATASGEWRLIVNATGLPAGKGVVAENADTGEALDAANVNNNGNVVFELPAVQNTRINIQSGAAELKVFQESNPSQLVDGATLRIRVFGSDTVIEREVTNGRLDLTDVPLDKRLTITASDQEDFIFRRITVPSAAEQEEIYLINGTANPGVSSINFRIDDRTGGSFSPGETQFFIEKPIKKDFDGDGSDETRYQVIAGDTIGSSREFPVTLKTDNRYRLRVTNDNGDSRQLGSYVVRGSDSPEVTIGRVVINSDSERGYATQFEVLRQDSNGDGTDEEFVRFAYRDRDGRTAELRYNIVNETSGQTIENKALTNVNSHTFTTQVAPNQTSSTHRVDWSADRTTDDGTTETVSGERFAGDIPEIAGRLPIDPRWLELIGYVSIFAVAGLIVIISGPRASLVTTGWAGLLTLLGIVSIPPAAIGLAGAVSVFAVVGGRR